MREFKKEANIFIGNLNKDVTAKQLDEHFQKDGMVLSCSVRYNNEGESFGFGYVQFYRVEDADIVIEKYNNKELFGQVVKLAKFKKVESKQQRKNLYIKNFPEHWDKDKITKKINKIFKALGNVTSVGIYDYVAADQKQQFYAFVAYENELDA